MRQLLKKSLQTIYLEDFMIDFLTSIRETSRSISWHIKRDLTGIDEKIIEDYFTNHKTKKLHIGCGRNILKGWLNSDYYPRLDQTIYLDATKPFPIKDDEFDYVFSEHMIEHITYPQGLQMLTECYRVLKPRGKLRIATPDLLFLIDLYRNEKSWLQTAYVKWATDNFIKTAPCYEDVFVINNFMRGFGHKFIYNEKVLHYSLEKVGFSEITKCDLNDSEDEELRGLENESRMPGGFLRLESIVLEGTKS
jgi:predicted SAM-dependent methyltransferase